MLFVTDPLINHTQDSKVLKEEKHVKSAQESFKMYMDTWIPDEYDPPAFLVSATLLLLKQ